MAQTAALVAPARVDADFTVFEPSMSIAARPRLFRQQLKHPKEPIGLSVRQLVLNIRDAFVSSRLSKDAAETLVDTLADGANPKLVIEITRLTGST